MFIDILDWHLIMNYLITLVIQYAVCFISTMHCQPFVASPLLPDATLVLKWRSWMNNLEVTLLAQTNDLSLKGV